MKKIYGLCASLFLVFPLAAEEVSSVSFNPSRLGDYTYLKVSGEARLQGGLQTPALNVDMTSASASRVTLRADTPAAPYFGIAGTLGNPNTTIDMPSATFHKGSSAITTYSVSSANPSDADLITLTATGGEMILEDDSFIQALAADNHLFQYASTLEGTTVNVLGAGGAAVSLIKSSGEQDGSSEGLKLGGVDIPYPRDFRYRGDGDSGATSFPLDADSLSSYQLAWVQRSLYDGAGTVYVLALAPAAGTSSSAPVACPETVSTPPDRHIETVLAPCDESFGTHPAYKKAYRAVWINCADDTKTRGKKYTWLQSADLSLPTANSQQQWDESDCN